VRVFLRPTHIINDLSESGESRLSGGGYVFFAFLEPALTGSTEDREKQPSQQMCGDVIFAASTKCLRQPVLYSRNT